MCTYRGTVTHPFQGAPLAVAAPAPHHIPSFSPSSGHALTATAATPPPEAAEIAGDVGSVVLLTAALAVALVVAVAAGGLVAALVRRAGRRTAVADDLVRRCRRPLSAVLAVAAVWVALRVATENALAWRPPAEHALFVALIVTTTWLVGALAFVLEDVAMRRYRVDVKDNRTARRVRTQVQVVRRLTVAVLVVVAIAGILMTFPAARAVGTSIFASAGLLSIVAGLAAQSSLANVFAGLQLAFTGAIRVDDVVIADDEWGRIEEITLTYVVVHVWDDRRLILPSTYFTTTPFENWTRSAADLLGTVEIDVDWHVPVDAMRAELTRLLHDTELWDGRVGVLQVTDAVNGLVRVRALASAVDAPTLFDLRCHVREGLVAWLRGAAPEALPRTRWDSDARHVVLREPSERRSDGSDAHLFTGSIEAVTRSQAFTGPHDEEPDGDDGTGPERERSAGAPHDGDRWDAGAGQRPDDGATDEVVDRGDGPADAGTGGVREVAPTRR